MKVSYESSSTKGTEITIFSRLVSFFPQLLATVIVVDCRSCEINVRLVELLSSDGHNDLLHGDDSFSRCSRVLPSPLVKPFWRPSRSTAWLWAWRAALGGISAVDLGHEREKRWCATISNLLCSESIIALLHTGSRQSSTTPLWVKQVARGDGTDTVFTMNGSWSIYAEYH